MMHMMSKQFYSKLSICHAPKYTGLAHLMEHIVLSSSRAKTKVIERKARKLWKRGVENNRFGRSISNEDDLSDEQDFEDWLSDNDGDSNAFTAPGFVCFHFNAPHETLPGEYMCRKHAFRSC